MVQRVGTNICQQYVPTLFVDNNGTEGGYWYIHLLPKVASVMANILACHGHVGVRAIYLQTVSLHTVDIYKYPPSVLLFSTNRAGTYC
jgi:hypothetical protein